MVCNAVTVRNGRLQSGEMIGGNNKGSEQSTKATHEGSSSRGGEVQNSMTAQSAASHKQREKWMCWRSGGREGGREVERDQTQETAKDREGQRQ